MTNVEFVEVQQELGLNDVEISKILGLALNPKGQATTIIRYKKGTNRIRKMIQNLLKVLLYLKWNHPHIFKTVCSLIRD